MIILYIHNNSIHHYIEFIYSLFNEYSIKIIFIKNSNQLINEIKKYKNNNHIFIDYFNEEIFQILKFIYNISIYYYTNTYSNELLEKLNEFSNKIDFNILSHNDNYKYIKSISIFYLNQKNIKLIIDDIFYRNRKIEKDGFIVLTHVKDEKTNKLWNHNIFQLRQFHNHKIIIIDDNSNQEYLKLDNVLLKKYKLIINKNDLNDVIWIKSDYPQAGEILPYYYLYTKQLFERAMIIHDSTFVQKKININTENIDYLWHFEHHANDYDNEIKMINYLKNEDLIQSYDAKKWYGCFGCQTFIHYDFIKKVQEKFNIFSLLEYINNRSKRMNFERIFSLLCTETNKELYNKKSIYGNILEYLEWGLTFDSYIHYKSVYIEYDLIKTWSGR